MIPPNPNPMIKTGSVEQASVVMKFTQNYGDVFHDFPFTKMWIYIYIYTIGITIIKSFFIIWKSQTHN